MVQTIVCTYSILSHFDFPQLVGMRLSLILGSMCSIPITLALFMPFNITILIGQAINGIGENLCINPTFIHLFGRKS